MLNAIQVLEKIELNNQMMEDGERAIDAGAAITNNWKVWFAGNRLMLDEKRRIGDTEPLWQLHQLDAHPRVIENGEKQKKPKPKNGGFLDEFIK
jgi:hypothetical protein